MPDLQSELGKIADAFGTTPMADPFGAPGPFERAVPDLKARAGTFGAVRVTVLIEATSGEPEVAEQSVLATPKLIEDIADVLQAHDLFRGAGR